MHVAIHPERHDEHVHLPYQGLWFVLLLTLMLLLLSKNVATTIMTIDDGRSTDGRSTMADQCVIEYSRMLIPIA